jgi:hypothetical protein
MGKTSIVICEVCGGTTPSGAADFVLFHCLTFCSPDCLGDYRTADHERRAKKDADRTTQQPRAGRSRAA